jgi:endonuclease YncB( thermonuclease family)
MTCEDEKWNQSLRAANGRFGLKTRARAALLLHVLTAFRPDSLMAAGGFRLTARIRPAMAALSAVIVLMAALLIWQSYDRRSTTASASASHPRAGFPETPRANVSLVGTARVIDGNTIDIRGTRIRLNGIDAPEMRQACEADGRVYPCGERSTEALRGLIGNRQVRCSQEGRDRYQRMIARCAVDGTDAALWMVEHGWAIADRKNSLDYAAAQERARAQKSGIWAGKFLAPEEWRGAKATERSACRTVMSNAGTSYRKCT